MKKALVRMVMAVALVGAAASASLAGQTTTASTETKTFEILGVTGNTLIVRLPEGTREITVADDFRFNVNGKPLAVRELKPGMKGSATITTRTTVTPVTVTEVKDGTVALSTGGTIIVRTDEGIKSFTQGDIDKRGVKIIRNGVPAAISDFREGDRLSATIVTSMPPKVVTEQDVQATLAKANPAGAAAKPAAGGGTASASASATASGSGSAAATAPAARRLPKTASSWPLLGVTSAFSLAIGFALTLRRRFVA